MITLEAGLGHLAGRLGGDSVLAVRMPALVRKRLSVELALSDVTVEITLAALADLVMRAAGTARPRGPFPSTSSTAATRTPGSR